MSNDPQHSQRKHSLLAPSSASTWTECTASVQLIEANADRIVDKGSKYAEEGTLAHECADAKMRGQKAPRNATSEMLDHAAGYKRFITSLVGEIDAEGVERELPLPYLPSDNGHVDFVQYLVETKELHVVDYKYGAGVSVGATENKQMAVYAMAAIEALKIPTEGLTVHMHIYQPRTKEAGESPASSWSLPFDWFSLFYEKNIAVKAAIILQKADHLLTYAPSDKTCRWCKAAEFCTARTEHLLTGAPIVRKLMSSPTASAAPPAPSTLSEEQLEGIMQHADGIISWLGDVKDYAFERAMEGRKIKGTKLVRGKGSRTWTDEDKAEQIISLVGADPYKRQIISPYQAEQLLKGKKKALTMLSEITLRNEGKPRLVLDSDPSPEFVRLNVEHEFDKLLTFEDLI